MLDSVETKVFGGGEHFARVISGPARGCFLPIRYSSGLRLVLGLYELEIRHFIWSFTTPDSTCYDIGAAYGYYSLAFAKLASQGYVYALDPDPRLCQLLESARSRNPSVAGRIRILNLRVSDVVHEETRSTTIDHLVLSDGCKPPSLLKIDVEGEELAVLHGARVTIDRFAPKIILEVHSERLEAQCRGFLEQSGYTVVVVDQAAPIPEKRPLPHNRWLCATATPKALGSAHPKA